MSYTGLGMGPGERCYYQRPGMQYAPTEYLPETPALEILDPSWYRRFCDTLVMWNPARYEYRTTDGKCVNRVLNQGGMCSWEMAQVIWAYILCQLADGRVVYDWGPPPGGPGAPVTEVCEVRCLRDGKDSACWRPIYPVQQKIPSYQGSPVP